MPKYLIFLQIETSFCNRLFFYMACLFVTYHFSENENTCSTKELKNIFNMFKALDQDRNMYIELDDFNLNPESDNEWFYDMDVDNDTKISPQEFDEDIAWMGN